ncbi:MAG: hypothetical protein ACJ757_14475 [Gaiellaceae bacterium]
MSEVIPEDEDRDGDGAIGGALEDSSPDEGDDGGIGSDDGGPGSQNM